MTYLLIPAKQHRIETSVSNSRFLAIAAPVFSVDAAKEFIAEMRAEFHDASHNVPAFLIGHGATSTSHCSDDGEPSGTAGRPILAVLQGSHLGDIAIVVTRYFGGTKLGTGGLVRAYGNAAKEVVKTLPRARKVTTHSVLIVLPYSLYEQSRNIVVHHQGITLDEDFGAEVSISARFPVDSFSSFQDDLRNLSRGAIQASIIEANQPSIIPVGTD
jgi:uncharacterized YigZ family protein